jgi:hypothetical protein
VTATGLAAVCGRARPEPASLGDLGTALVATLGVVERAGAGRGVDALTDPAFALDVLTTEPGVDPACWAGSSTFSVPAPAASPSADRASSRYRSPWPTRSPATSPGRWR